jgi:hypothetical protein
VAIRIDCTNRFHFVVILFYFWQGKIGPIFHLISPLFFPRIFRFYLPWQVAVKYRKRARVAAEEELYRGEGQMNETIRAADKLLHEISRLKKLHAKRKMLGARVVARENFEGVVGSLAAGCREGVAASPSSPNSRPHPSTPPPPARAAGGFDWVK